MISSTTKSFRDRFERLEPRIRELAVNNYWLWRRNPSHPSLHFKKVGQAFWSIRVGMKHRALAKETDSGIVWFWIGNHDEYERMIARSR